MNVLWLLGLDLSLPWWFVVFVCPFVAYMTYMSWHFRTFAKLGIPYRRPIPLLGTSYLMMKAGLREYELSCLTEMPKVFGEFMGRFPMLVVRDHDMLKEIFVKQFNNFTNRNNIVQIEEKPMKYVLSRLNDEHWKHVRNILTPTFSGLKLRMMMKQIHRAADQLCDILGQKCDANEVVNIRQVTGAFTMDVIASTTFGLHINTQQEPDNDFNKYAHKLMNRSMKNPFMALIFFAPFLTKYSKYFNISVMDKEAGKFFYDVIRQTIRQREDANIEQKDFIKIMMDAHKEVNGESTDTKEIRGLTEDEMVAQAFIFFLAGFETTGNTLSFLMYNLAVNPHIQDKVIEEIDSVMEGHDHPTYELMKKMPYLDMCFDENLRIYPQATRVDRVAREDCTIKGIHIPKGMVVSLLALANQMDPEVWPEPEKFIPERWTSEEKDKRDPYSYFPFGHGPRNCVGMRLAMLESKVAFVKILMKYKFVKCEETRVPLVVEKMRQRADIKLKIEARK